jgi:hypothetical protein
MKIARALFAPSAAGLFASRARSAIESARSINPELSLATVSQMFNIANNHPDNRKFWLASLRKAGMPE